VWEMSDGDITGIESEISYRAVENMHPMYPMQAPKTNGPFSPLTSPDAPLSPDVCLELDLSC